MIQYANNQQPKQVSRYKKPLIVCGVALIVMLAAGLVAWWWRQDADEPLPQPVPAAVVNEVPASEPVEKPPAEFDKTAIKAAVDDWAKNHAGTYAVVVTTEAGKPLVNRSGDKSFFAASIYKLYVAYEGYKKIDDGTYKLSQPYLSGFTREECLDKMIRESDSPCAEKLWVELGKDSLDAKMKTYGLTNTSMTSITTSAHDAAVMLARIQTGDGLSDSSRSKFLASMKAQIYDEGFKTGFKNQNVYDKVGFREQVEYHDVGIIKFEDGRVLIVSALTQNAGTKNIAGLAAAIATAAEKP